MFVCPDGFDPVLIADKLRTVADALNEDVKFKAVLTNLKQAAAQEVHTHTHKHTHTHTHPYILNALH